MSILGDRFNGKKRTKYTRPEAKLALKLAQEGKPIPVIAKELSDANVSPKDRSLNSVQYLVRTVLAPMTSMEQFNARFPEAGATPTPPPVAPAQQAAPEVTVVEEPVKEEPVAVAEEAPKKKPAKRKPAKKATKATKAAK